MRAWKVWFAAVWALAACSEPDGLTPRLRFDDNVRIMAPDLAAALEARRDILLAGAADEADVALRTDGGNLRLEATATPVMDRRDVAFADTIAPGTDPALLALIITARSHAVQAADDVVVPGEIAQLRDLAMELAEALNDTDPNLPLAEDLRTSYRQVLFQIAMGTMAEGDANALLAFEKAEAKETRGVDAPDRFESARAWYYFASAVHLTADLSDERDIAYAFSGFKDAQRPAIREREVGNETPRTDQDLIAARVRIGQLLTAISNVREDEKLAEEAAFAFRSAAGLWYDVMGTEQTFCYRVDIHHEGGPTCVTPDEAESPTFEPS